MPKDDYMQSYTVEIDVCKCTCACMQCQRENNSKVKKSLIQQSNLKEKLI